MNAALQTTFAGMTRALTPAPRRGTLADAWRINMQDIREDIRFIGVYRQVLAEKDMRLPGGRLVHSPSYSAACETNLKRTLASYAARVRRITETEEAMTAAGIAFAKSSDAWQAELEDA